MGVSSYLLIGFYYTKPEAIAASKKAFIVTRFADLGFLLGILLLSYFTKKVGIEKVRVYLACENVWYWSKRQGFDPRYSYSGATSQATYSPVRTISGGINIQF